MKRVKTVLLLLGILLVFYLLLDVIYLEADYTKLEGLENKYTASLSDIEVTLHCNNAVRTTKASNLLHYEFVEHMSNWFLAVFQEPVVDAYLRLNEGATESWLMYLYTEPEDAYIKIDSIEIYLIPEVTDFSIDIDAATTLVEAALLNEEFAIDISSTVIRPEITTETLSEIYENIAWLSDWHVTYSKGLTVNYYDVAPYISDFVLDYDSVNFELLKEYVMSNYDTSSKSLWFYNSNEEYVDVPYKTYGYIVDWQKEVTELYQLLRDHESQDDRVPIMYGYDNLKDTYIEVSIKDQHLWHYVDGEVCCETPIVTGTKGKHDTPVGVYFISERINGKYLTGDDYRTWVNKWMRLTNSGIGLHDAYWRSSFGKSIYTYDGSHGCVNMPKNFAYKLFDEVSVGYPVIIY